MSRVVCLDSNVVVWGVKRQATAGQEHMIEKAISLIRELEKEKAVVIVATPAMAELLSPLSVEEQGDFMDLINDVFKVPSFDMAAAALCARLFADRSKDLEMKQYREDKGVHRETMKFDLQIISIAIVNGADCIYSEDPDIAKFAKGAIKVLSMPPSYTQTELALVR